MDRDEKLYYDQRIESFRPKSGCWIDVSHCILGIIEGIADFKFMAPREKISRIQYVLARFNKLKEEDAQKWRL